MTSTRSDSGRLRSDLSQLYRLPGQVSYNQLLAFSFYVPTQVHVMVKEPRSGALAGLTANNPDLKRCLSLRQAARYARRSPAAIAFAIRSGELKASRFGRNWRIRLENLNAWIDSYQG